MIQVIQLKAVCRLDCSESLVELDSTDYSAASGSTDSTEDSRGDSGHPDSRAYRVAPALSGSRDWGEGSQAGLDCLVESARGVWAGTD